MKNQNDNLDEAINALKNESVSTSPPQEVINETLQKVTQAGQESQSVIIKERNKIMERIKAMKTFTKLAAAAVIIIAAVLSITLLHKSVTPAYGITDLPQLLRSAKALHVKAWSYFPEDTTPGRVQRRVALENWFDLENSFSRIMNAGYNNVPDNTTLSLLETVCDGQYKMVINHSEKTVSFQKLSPFQQELYIHQNMWDFVSQMLADPGRLDEFKRTGEEVIDGIWYDIWEGQSEHPVWQHTWRVQSWVAPDTGELAYACIWVKRYDGEWSRSYEVEKVQRNVNISSEVFATEPPFGYKQLNTKDAAQIQELNCGLTCYQKEPTVTVSTKICFTLPDGSVILVWHSEDTESDISQAEVFENLRAGGPLPKLPIEIYALKSIGGGETVTYDGYHLCHTVKSGKFYEWSIYVPAQLPFSRSNFLGYQTIPRFNPPQDRALFSLPVYNDLQIEDEKQFNKWVLGAMGELSEDGRMPDYVTYDYVLQLSEQISESLTE